MRLIDAEWLEELFPDTGEGEWTYNATALGYIDSAPSIDIVRCRECKYDGTWKCPWRNTQVPRYPNADDFCSYGSSSEKPNNSTRSILEHVGKE